MIVSLIVGGGVGYSSAKFGLESLSDGLMIAGDIFGLHIAPWMMLAMAVILPIMCVPLYRSVKMLLASWDGENEEISDAIDGKLSIVIWITGAALIISYFLIAASYSGGFSIFENNKSILPFFISIVAFIGIMIEAVILQQKCVDAAKKTNPENREDLPV